MEFKEKVFELIAQVCQDDVVKEEHDIDLFEEGLLDSMGTVELLVLFEEQLDIHVPITEFDRETWNTPKNIVDRLNELK